MALGDGTTWDETVPTDSSNAVDIDDYNRDVRKGVRLRMANEHEWVSSDSTTSASGMHKFMTMQEQGAKPTLSGTQEGALYIKTDLGLYFENSAGSEILISHGTAIGTTGSSIVCATMTAGNVTITGTLALTGGFSALIFGTRIARSFTTTYQATKDGILYGYNVGGGVAGIKFYVSATTAPSILAMTNGNGYGGAGGCVPVKNDEYYKVTADNSGQVWFMEIG